MRAVVTRKVNFSGASLPSVTVVSTRAKNGSSDILRNALSSSTLKRLKRRAASGFPVISEVIRAVTPDRN